jgi:hypothetical protein
MSFWPFFERYRPLFNHIEKPKCLAKLLFRLKILITIILTWFKILSILYSYILYGFSFIKVVTFAFGGSSTMDYGMIIVFTVGGLIFLSVIGKAMKER